MVLLQQYSNMYHDVNALNGLSPMASQIQQLHRLQQSQLEQNQVQQMHRLNLAQMQMQQAQQMQMHNLQQYAMQNVGGQYVYPAVLSD